MSATLLPDGPVIKRESIFFKNVFESLFIRKSLMLRSFCLNNSREVLSNKAPAALVGPSIPSVPTDKRETILS